MLKNIVNIPQKDNESLLDWIGRLKAQRDIAKEQLGTRFLDTWIEKTQTYKDAATELQKEALKTTAFDKFIARLVIVECDSSKYGTKKEELRERYAGKHPEYPDKLEDAVDLLSSHKWDNSKKRSKSKDKSEDKKKDEGGESSFAQKAAEEKSRVCFICGQSGHIKPKCPKGDSVPKAQWWINTVGKAAQHAQTEGAGGTGSNTGNESGDGIPHWSGVGQRGSQGMQSGSQGFQTGVQLFQHVVDEPDDDSDDELPELLD